MSIIALDAAEAEVLGEETIRQSSSAFLDIGEVRTARAEVVALAILNNLPFSVILSATQHFLTNELKMPDLSPLITFGCVVAALVGSAVNVWLIHGGWSLRGRVVLVCAFQGASSLALAAATLLKPRAGLAMTMVGVTAIGLGQAFGETSLIADLKVIPPALGMWGLGTGLSGLAGPVCYVAMGTLGASDMCVFLATLGVPVLYWLVFARPSKLLDRAAAQRLMDSSEEHPGEEDGRPGMPRIGRVIRHTGFVALNLVLVYSLEYGIYPGMVDVDTRHPPDPDSVLQRNTYALALTCYNVGVTVSRFSVNYVQIRAVWIMTVAQAANYALWVWEARAHWLRDQGDGGHAAMLAWMVWVGFMGGASYANCCYRINHDTDVPEDVRRTGIPVAFGFVNIGIMVASVVGIYLNKTLLHEADPVAVVAESAALLRPGSEPRGIEAGVGDAGASAAHVVDGVTSLLRRRFMR